MISSGFVRRVEPVAMAVVFFAGSNLAAAAWIASTYRKLLLR